MVGPGDCDDLVCVCSGPADCPGQLALQAQLDSWLGVASSQSWILNIEMSHVVGWGVSKCMLAIQPWLVQPV